RVSPDVWVTPVSAYATLAVATIGHLAQPGRRAAALFGALGIALSYVLAAARFRQRALAWIAALLLMSNPAYITSARSGALDGTWIIPPLLLSLLAVTRFAETGARRWLAGGAAALVACAYTQPSGASLAMIVGVLSIIGLARARLLTVR